MTRITLKDVAERAGVGVATVDRVLNERAPVSAATAARVLAAAEAVNYHAHGLLRRRIEEMAPAKTLGFVLQKESKWFYQSLADELRKAAQNLRSIRASVEILFVESLSPDDLVKAVGQLQGRVDAIGLVAVDHPKINKAVVSSAQAGIPVFALLSPLSAPEIAGYVGIDGRKAGRTAGWAMSKLMQASGSVGILIGSHRYLGHEALEVGFRSYLREYAPDIGLRDSVVYLDDTAVAYEAAAEILRVAPDLNGLYHCGGGVRGAVKALEEAGRAHEISYVCHEQSPTAVQGLLEGTVDLVIASPVAEIATKATRAMARAIGGEASTPAEMVAEFHVTTPENC
ncbi:MAG: LacI family DNA-binding transcriptional regulator [Stappiaceae bacterium]